MLSTRHLSAPAAWAKRLGGAMALLGLSCSAAPEADGVVFGGCAAVLPGRRCWSPDGVVTLWTADRGGDEQVEVLVDDEPLDGAGVAVAGGHRREIVVEPGEAKQITVRVGPRRWSMSVVRELPEVTACIDGGDPELTTLEPGEAGLCLSRRGSRRMQAGDLDLAITTWSQAIGSLQSAGWEREVAITRAREAWATADRADVPDPQLPDPADASDAHLAYLLWYGRAQAAVQLGDHRGALGALRRAREATVRALPAEWTAELDERLAMTEARLGRPAAAVARYEAAVAVSSEKPCWAVDRLVAYAWGMELLRDAGVDLARLPPSNLLGGPPDPAALLERASRRWAGAPSQCEGRNRAADLSVDLAFDALWRGDLLRADALLDEAEQLPRNGDTDRWMYELRGRLLLANGQNDGARVAWRLASELSERAGDLELSWRAQDGLGRAALAEGKAAKALEAWDASREIFLRNAALVPLRHGRGTFLDQRSSVVAAHMRTLLDVGRPAEAFEVGRSWRAQLLATAWLVDRIDALDDTGRRRWEGVVADVDRLRGERQALIEQRRGAAADEMGRIDAELERLSQAESDALDTGMTALGVSTFRSGTPLREGEARLLAVRAPASLAALAPKDWARLPSLPEAQGWIPLLQDSAGVVSGAWVSMDAVSATPALLMAPFRERLRAAKRVTLLLPGALDALDLHAVGGADRLIDHATVGWSIDRPAEDRPAPVARRAVVVGDPGGGLEAARGEAVAVAAALREQGWEVTELGRGTTLADLLDALRGAPVDLLHFAGHGEVGEDPWDARLVLARGTAMSVRDVLALSAPPRLVTLAGCETGRTERIGIAGMGLATAFVTAGSEAVIATARKVDDGLAGVFSVALYEAMREAPEPAAAFRAAVLRVADSQPASDWSGFRLIVR